MHCSMGTFGFPDMICWSRPAMYRSDTSSCCDMKSTCRAKSWLTACDRPLRVTLPGYEVYVSTEYLPLNTSCMRTRFQLPLFLRVSWPNIVQVRQEWLVRHEFFKELLFAILKASLAADRQKERPKCSGRSHDGMCEVAVGDRGGWWWWQSNLNE